MTSVHHKCQSAQRMSGADFLLEALEDRQETPHKS